MKMLHKLRIALAAILLALAAVSAVDSASALGRTEDYRISTTDWYWWP
jgi:ABC-type glycerol-3-phosphate transport system substrate-binding protein